MGSFKIPLTDRSQQQNFLFPGPAVTWTFKYLKKLCKKSEVWWEMRIRNSYSRFVHLNKYRMPTLCQALAGRWGYNGAQSNSPALTECSRPVGKTDVIQ